VLYEVSTVHTPTDEDVQGGGCGGLMDAESNRCFISEQVSASLPVFGCGQAIHSTRRELAGLLLAVKVVILRVPVPFPCLCCNENDTSLVENDLYIFTDH
jgi:hypothetical protein